MKIWEQVILLGVALSMIWPTWYTDIIGAAIFPIVYFHQKAVKTREDSALEARA